MSEKNEIVLYKEEEQLEEQVNENAKELSRQIAKATNTNELDPLYDAFKINDAKKSVFRINKLNDLLDKVTDEALARFEQRPGEMSNKEVIDYMNVVQNQIDRFKDTVDKTREVKLTQVNNNVNININKEEPTLNRESRERIIDFIKEVLYTHNDNVIDAEVSSDTPDREGNDNE